MEKWCCLCRREQHRNYDQDVRFVYARNRKTGNFVLKGYICQHHRDILEKDFQVKAIKGVIGKQKTPVNLSDGKWSVYVVNGDNGELVQTLSNSTVSPVSFLRENKGKYPDTIYAKKVHEGVVTIVALEENK